ncbi:PTS system, maltose and glucose-specific IIC component [Anaerobranca californiensis DSM 14826]|uniref:PTS system, maltose and glucose-specific IIC component n=1 Tax=Anaerobranca californiensis DSM 14826 TaxID=1120989 RepID=A0A1M6MUG4_9FIRM|nr:PTS system, maltose and glucose-specific IIC component [Anaerobranca californiensis DSM 14826]
MKQNLKDFFQQLGRSFMLPISLLAATGIFLGLAAASANPQIQQVVPFLASSSVMYVTQLIRAISGTLLGNIPLLFAISLSLGMAKKEKPIAAFAGVIVFLVFNRSMMYVLDNTSLQLDAVGNVLGMNTVRMDALGGILVGLITAMIHNKYYNIKLPDAIAFFGGTRFVAIAVTVVFAVLGQIIPFIWEPISAIITGVGTSIAQLGYFGTFLFGFLERVLLPFGLHHILNSLARTTEIGGVAEFAGETVTGALLIFNRYLETGVTPDNLPLTEVTRFLAQGKIPMMVFGLPAAAYAMYKTADPAKRAKVKPLLLAGVLASFTTGITEPLEFAFLFVAPMSYLFHAVMAGISFMSMHLLGVMIGNTQGGIIDLLVFGATQPGSKWYMAIIVGVLFAVVYYNVFKWAIIKFNFATPGREENGENEDVLGDVSNKELEGLALQIIEGLGGKENIVALENCFTRLRVDVVDMTKVDERKIEKTGANGFIKPNPKHIQIIYGPKVNIIKDVVEGKLNM